MGDLIDSAKSSDWTPDWDWVEKIKGVRLREGAKRLYDANPTMPFFVAIYKANEKLHEDATREFCRPVPLG